MSNYLAIDTPVGRFYVLHDAKTVSRVFLPEQEFLGSSEHPRTAFEREVVRQFHHYFSGKRKAFNLAVESLVATDFQLRIWKALLEVPFGSVVTYGELAELVEAPGAARAVGNALNKNPLPVIVPCHRVVASNDIGGYAGGVALKRYLLHIEGISY